MNNPLKDCNLTNPECRDLGYCNGHETPNQPSNVDDELRERILRFYAYMNNTEYDLVMNEYLGKSEYKNWTNMLYMGVEKTVATITSDLKSHKERWQLDAKIEQTEMLIENAKQNTSVMAFVSSAKNYLKKLKEKQL